MQCPHTRPNNLIQNVAVFCLKVILIGLITCNNWWKLAQMTCEDVLLLFYQFKSSLSVSYFCLWIYKMIGWTSISVEIIRVILVDNIDLLSIWFKLRQNQGLRFISKHGGDILYLNSRHVDTNHKMEINKWNALINWKFCFLEYISSKAKTWISDVRLDKLGKC